MKAVADPDTMHFHQAMKELDKEKFKEALDLEVKNQYNMVCFEVTQRDSVPEGATILPTAWQMKGKETSVQEK